MTINVDVPARERLEITSIASELVFLDFPLLTACLQLRKTGLVKIFE
jgi:hypothetical protein